jgi:hypothetical protein
MCYAARSKQQAIEKRREYDACRKPSEGKSVDLVSFWDVYAEQCAEAGAKPLPKHAFASRRASEVMTTIKDRQPQVYRLIKNYQENLWSDANFECGTTMIFTTKATVRNWNAGHLTKTIFHPEFKLGLNPAGESRLAKDFGLGVVAFDELELDEFLHIWPECHHDLIKHHQETSPDWTTFPLAQRHGVYTNIRFPPLFPPPSFEQFDADMRVSLACLEKVRVDFDAFPYGCDRSESGIYRGESGKPFYLGIQDWFAPMVGRLNFLTTERLMTEVVRAAYRKGAPVENGRRRVRLACKHFEPPPELFPIPVEVFVDKRASARRVAELKGEIATRTRMRSSFATAWKTMTGC